MPPSCCVIGCKSRGTVPPGVVFFQLPLNKPTLLTQWLIVLDRVDWLPKPSHRICSLHFSNEDYVTKPNQGGAPRLKPDAIPSVFPDLGAEEDDAGASEDQKEKEDVSPKPTSKSKSSPVSTPANELPSGRPRRISKVSSKMKDYILFDDSFKRHRGSPATLPTTPQKGSQEGDNKAAQELLSILEDSNSLSGDEKKPTVSLKTPIGSSSANVKVKPAPASVKKARQLALTQLNDTKIKEPVGVKKVVSSKPKGSRTGSVDLKNTVIELNSGEKVIYLSYADLNPVADMTKNNVLLKKESSTPEKGTKNDGNEKSYNNDSDAHCPSPIPADQTDVSVASSFSPKRKIKKEKDNESAYANAVQAVRDVEVGDADSGVQGSKVISVAPSPAVAKTKRSINVASPIKKKKRFKAVAEIVVRTDNSGEVPNVSIEKMTTIESDTPKKKGKISSKPIQPIQNLSHSSGEDGLYNLSGRVAETVKQMKMMENATGNASKLTVLVSTLPSVGNSDVLVVKKKNNVADTDKNRELRVCVNSQQDHATPVVGICDIGSKENNNTLVRKAAALAMDNNEGEVSAPLQHDHTYISPSLKIGESDILGDDPPKDLLHSKLKLSEEEISYRNKVHKKLRFLKETVKRKNETINKLKQKVSCLEKSLRDERKVKKKLNMLGKIRQGIDSGIYEEMLDGDRKSLEYHLSNADLPMEFDETLDESEEEGRAGSRSPITYICEPAIDVCEKPVVQE